MVRTRVGHFANKRHHHGMGDHHHHHGVESTSVIILYYSLDGGYGAGAVCMGKNE